MNRLCRIGFLLIFTTCLYSHCLSQRKAPKVGVTVQCTERSWATRPDLYGLIYGPTMTVDLTKMFWLSAVYIQGKLKKDDISVKTYQWKVYFGRRIHIFHLNMDPGLGFCYSRVTYGADCPYRGVKTRINTHGPMLYLGMSGGLIRVPLEWYLCGTWMFTDVDDDAVYQEGEHLQIDCGLSRSFKGVEVRIGYFLRRHYLADVNLRIQGVTVSICRLLSSDK